MSARYPRLSWSLGRKRTDARLRLLMTLQHPSISLFGDKLRVARVFKSTNSSQLKTAASLTTRASRLTDQTTSKMWNLKIRLTIHAWLNSADLSNQIRRWMSILLPKSPILKMSVERRTKSIQSQKWKAVQRKMMTSWVVKSQSSTPSLDLSQAFFTEKKAIQSNFSTWLALRAKRRLWMTLMDISASDATKRSKMQCQPTTSL